MSGIDVLIVGLGPIGILASQIALERKDLNVVGGVDISPALAGRDLGRILGGADLGLPVSDLIPAAAEGGSSVAVLTTSSKLSLAAEQAKALVSSGWSVVTTCEEMAYPWLTQPEISQDLDRAAKSAGRAVLATGVNPGFAMDAPAVSADRRHAPNRINPGGTLSRRLHPPSALSTKDRGGAWSSKTFRTRSPRVLSGMWDSRNPSIS